MTRPVVHVYSDKTPLHDATIARALHAHALLSESELDSAVKTRPPHWMLFPFVHTGLAAAIDKCKASGIKTCAYWLGGDTYRALHDVNWRRQLPAFDKHICCHYRLASELRDAGIHAETVMFLARNVPDQYYPPAEPKVGVYMPSSRTSGNYQLGKMCDIAEAVPELPFVFYGCDELPTLPANVTNAGRYTQEGASHLLRAFSVLVRFTLHDGLPQNIIEMKMQGKHCIASFPYFGCIYADSVEGVARQLRKPETHERDTSDWPAWYKAKCSPEAFAADMYKHLEANAHLPCQP